MKISVKNHVAPASGVLARVGALAARLGGQEAEVLLVHAVGGVRLPWVRGGRCGPQLLLLLQLLGASPIRNIPRFYLGMRKSNK